MNRDDRRRLRDLVSTLEMVRGEIEDLSGDLQERLANLEEHFSGGPTVEALENEVAGIEDAAVDLDNVVDILGELVG